MKLFIQLISLVLATTFSFPALAANPRCGVGTWIFGSSKGALSQCSEIQTNNMSSGASSISSGTSGCKHNGNFLFGMLKINQQQIDFFNANYEELLVEMSQGEGEILNGLAHMVGCTSKEAIKKFGIMTQKNLPSLKKDIHQNPIDMLINTKQTMFMEKDLLNICGLATTG